MSSIMEVADPYSQSCVEPKSKPAEYKAEKIQKFVRFYSQAGQRRLRRIWDDNLLDDEILFTGIVEPSDSFAREKVSDYVQHYLLRRARRCSFENILGFQRDFTPPPKVNKNANKNSTIKPKQHFEAYDKYISKRNAEIDQRRMNEETQRMHKLLISGEIKFPPDDLQGVLEDPIYKMNQLHKSIRALGNTEIRINKIPFSVRTLPIKSKSEMAIMKLKPNSVSLNDDTTMLLGSMESLAETPKNPEKLGFKDAEDESVSSGFDEFITSTPIDPSMEKSPVPPPQPLKSRLSSLWSLVELPLLVKDRARSFSLMSEMTDDELSVCAEEHFANEVVTGDLEISKEFQWDYMPLALVKEQDNGNDLFEVASKVVSMYQRQGAVSDEFYEDFVNRHFTKSLN